MKVASLLAEVLKLCGFTGIVAMLTVRRGIERQTNNLSEVSLSERDDCYVGSLENPLFSSSNDSG
jgi:hypothetical protein